MTYSLSPYLSFIQSEYDKAKILPVTQIGAYKHAYEFIFALISRDAQGREILHLNGSGQLVNRAGAVVNLSTWSLANEADNANWTFATGVDAGAWTFLRGMPHVNNNEGAYSDFIREYTKAQYLTRTGTVATDAQVQAVSNGIAENILLDILSKDKFNNDTNLNPNHNIPDINGIAVNDARAAAENLFGLPQIAGWAGNPFLLAVGHSSSFQNNILEHAGDTYDLLSIIKSMQDVMVSDSTNLIQLFELFMQTIGVVQITGAESVVDKAVDDAENFMLQAYGSVGSLYSLKTLDIKLGLGADQADNITASAGGEFIHSGGGDDYIKGSLLDFLDDTDVVDGGSGVDTLDFSQLGSDIELDSHTGGFTGFYMEIDRAWQIGSTTYAFNIENLKLGGGDDFVNLTLDSNASLQRLDTNQGNDEVGINLVAGHSFKELHTGQGDDTVSISGAAQAFNPVVYLGDGNDTLLNTTRGSIVYGGAGADRFELGQDYLIADADATDHITYYGVNLSGGVRWKGQESPWAVGAYGGSIPRLARGSGATCCNAANDNFSFPATQVA